MQILAETTSDMIQVSNTNGWKNTNMPNMKTSFTVKNSALVIGYRSLNGDFTYALQHTPLKIFFDLTQGTDGCVH